LTAAITAAAITAAAITAAKQKTSTSHLIE
jgi:hypothetical protein